MYIYYNIYKYRGNFGLRITNFSNCNTATVQQAEVREIFHFLFVNRNENVLPLHCQIERRNLRGAQEKIPLWPSSKISLGRPQKRSLRGDKTINNKQ